MFLNPNFRKSLCCSEHDSDLIEVRRSGGVHDSCDNIIYIIYFVHIIYTNMADRLFIYCDHKSCSQTECLHGVHYLEY